MRDNIRLPLAQSKRFRTASIFGFWLILLWLTLGGNMVFLSLGLEIKLPLFGFSLLLIPLPFTTIFKSYLRKPIDSMFFPISTFIGYIALIILHAISLNMFATDPHVLYNPFIKAGLIIFMGATVLSILSLCACIITYILGARRTNGR